MCFIILLFECIIKQLFTLVLVASSGYLWMNPLINHLVVKWPVFFVIFSCLDKGNVSHQIGKDFRAAKTHWYDHILKCWVLTLYSNWCWYWTETFRVGKWLSFVIQKMVKHSVMLKYEKLLTKDLALLLRMEK